jgi:hypothetical protein
LRENRRTAYVISPEEDLLMKKIQENTCKTLSPFAVSEPTVKNQDQKNAALSISECCGGASVTNGRFIFLTPVQCKSELGRPALPTNETTISLSTINGSSLLRPLSQNDIAELSKMRTCSNNSLFLPSL